MAKNFFQDMIKMKSDLRKDSGVTPPVPKIIKVESLPEESEVKAQVQNSYVAKPRAIEQVEEPYTPIYQPTPVSTPAHQEPTEAWPPVVANKVTRRVELTGEGSSKRPRYSIWMVAAAAIVFLFFAVSYLFSKASVTINPKIKDVPYNQNLTATKDTSPDGGLTFDLIVLSGEETKTVEGGEEKDASIKARGTVLIYNNFSSASQRLDIDTRLEGSNGKLYKTEKAVVVPAMSGKTPGSVEVGIYGAEAGEAYNSDPLDFQIFGFKGTPKYSKFYARSQGSITGGYIGKVSAISDTKKATILNDMKETLQAKLVKKGTDLIPTGFILFKDAIFLNIDSQEFGAPNGTQVPVTLKGTFYGFIFDEKELTKKIVKTAIPDYDDSDVYIANLKDMNFTFLKKEGSTPSDISNISFNLAGTPKVVWRLDTAKLTEQIAGKSKKEFYQILGQYPNVVSANVLLRPFWKMSFPSNKNDVQVIVNYPQ